MRMEEGNKPPQENVFWGVVNRVGGSGLVSVLGAGVAHAKVSAPLVHNVPALGLVMGASELGACGVAGGFIGVIWALQYLLVGRGGISKAVEATIGKVVPQNLDRAAGDQVEAAVRALIAKLKSQTGFQGFVLRGALELSGALAEPAVASLVENVQTMQEERREGRPLSQLVAISAAGVVTARLDDLKFLAVGGAVAWVLVFDGLLLLLDKFL